MCACAEGGQESAGAGELEEAEAEVHGRGCEDRSTPHPFVPHFLISYLHLSPITPDSAIVPLLYCSPEAVA